MVKLILCSIKHNPIKTYGVIHNCVISQFICGKRAPCIITLCIYRVGRWVVRRLGLNAVGKSRVCASVDTGTRLEAIRRIIGTLTELLA